MAEFVPKDNWEILKRSHRLHKVPHGYKICAGDDSIFEPDLDQIQYIERALDYIDDGNTYREVAEWLTKKLGKPISHSTLSLIWKTHRSKSKFSEKARIARKKAREKTPLTPEEKRILAAKRAVMGAKRSLQVKERKLKEALPEPETIPQFLFATKVKENDTNIYNEDEVIFRPNPGPQTAFLAAPEREVLYGGAAGGGKAQPYSALVATPTGFRPIGALSVGDEVVNPAGGIAKVTQLHPQGVVDIYRVVFQDGSSTFCTADHLWMSKPLRDSAERWEVRSTKEIMSSPRTFVVPLTEPVNFIDSELPIEPYTLGALLGDGSITTNSISICASETHIISRIAETYTVTKRSSEYDYGIVGLVKYLKVLSLLGKNSHNKFVPDVYKVASYQQRLALIQGLMDTDGYVSSDGKVNYTTMSDQLRKDMAWLIRSVGGTATLMRGHTLYIRHPDSATLFSLPRKTSRCHKKVINNRILRIERSHREEAICITLDSDNKLYLTDDFIVTHNSYGLLADPMRYFSNPNFNGLILRRTTDELRELKWKSVDLYERAFPGAKWNEKNSLWTFPSGARLWLTYLERDEDVRRYQGQSFSYIAVDELTQYATPFAWDYLRSRLRTTDPNLPIFMRACVDEGEVLTVDGWKDIRDVNVGDIVYSVDKMGQLVTRRVHTAARYHVNEDIVRVQKKNLYMSMTKDHRVLHKPYGSSACYISRWNEHTGKSIAIVRTPSSYAGEAGAYCPVGQWDDIAYAKFLGWYVAEGSYVIRPDIGKYAVIISQLKAQDHEEIRSILESGGYNVCYSVNGDFQISNKALATWVSDLGKANTKHFPVDFIKQASLAQLEAAFTAYMKGDGHWQSKTSGTAVTTSRLLVDQLCEIGIKLGYKVQYSSVEPPSLNHAIRYNVYFTKNSTTTKVDKNSFGRNDVSYVQYNGNVYCIGVEETETFIIRQKGYVWVSGNTTNPGGPGHGWVKRMFIDPAPPNTPFAATDIDTGETLVYPDNHHDVSLRGKPLFYRRFIPAKLSDNPYLFDNGQYEQNLLSMSEMQRRQLLDGDWTIAEGAAFPEFRAAPPFVIEPFEIPSNWTRFRSADYGYASYSAVHWFAIDPAYETLIVYRELYVSKKTGTALADLILQAEAGEKIQYGILDNSVWHQRGNTGPSIAEEMIMRGCRWRPADRGQGSRTAGKNRLHELLKLRDFYRADGELYRVPGIQIFNNCRQIISDLQVIPVHPNGLDDIDDRYASDHTYDSIRYGIMSRPRSNSLFDFSGPQYGSSFRPSDMKFGY